MWVWPHIASLTTPVNVFWAPDVRARIETVPSSAVAARARIAFVENAVFMFLSPYFEVTA
jgi:hypothetical protein